MPVDKTRPTLSSATPADDSGNVAPGANIELVFSEAVLARSGKIFITNGVTQTYMGRDGSLQTRIVNATDTRTIDIGDSSQVTIVGNKVIIDPAANLHATTGYSVVIGASVLSDLAGNTFAGITDGNRLNFITGTGERTLPSARAATITLDAGSDSGTIGDGLTSDTQPWVTVHLAGTSGYRVGDVIEVQEDGFEGLPAGSKVLTAGDFDANGNLLSASLAVALTGDMLYGAEGTHAFMVRIADAEGNYTPGDFSDQLLELTFDTTAPEATFDHDSFNFIFAGTANAIDITGTLAGAADGDIVEYTLDQGETWLRAELDGATIHLRAGQPGGGAVGLRVLDAAGNVGSGYDGTGGYDGMSTVYIGDNYGGEFTISEGTALFARGGDDRITITDPYFSFIDGGAGDDTLYLGDFGTLYLDPDNPRLANLERLDLGSGVERNAAHRVEISGSQGDSAFTLTIDGDEDDTVVLHGTNWVQNGEASGGYWTFRSEDAVLLIGTAIRLGMPDLDA